METQTPSGNASSTAKPSKIRLTKDRRAISILWDDGNEALYASAVLRANCQSAPSKSKALHHGQPTAQDFQDLAIRDVRPIGQYAINIVFSDGHDRGIYPWPLLKEISATHAGDN